MHVALRLLKVSSLATSLGLYVPAVIGQKLLGMLRILLFAYLLRGAMDEFGLWGLGLMVFNLVAAVVTLGSNNGLMRYASHFDVRNRLEEFHRRVRWAVLILAVVLTAVAFACSEWITRAAFSSKPDVANRVSFDRQLLVCWLALGNALVVALYHNILGFAMGLRMYRLAAVLEVSFSVAFTVVGIVAMTLVPGSLALLSAHLGVLVAVVFAGAILLRKAVFLLAREGAGRSPGDVQQVLIEPGSEAEDISPPALARGVSDHAGERESSGASHVSIRQVFAFGGVSLVGNLLWQAAVYISFWLVNKEYGHESAGVFAFFLMLAQPIMFLGNAAWTVLFTHVARRWEENRKPEAMLSLQAGYKAVTLSVLAIAVLLKATAPLWQGVLPASLRGGVGVFFGLLLFFQAMNHLSLVTILARLRERPGVVGAIMAAGGAANYVLARWWMGSYGMTGAAWAAGVGVFVAGGALSVVYLALSRTSLRGGTWLAMLLPAILLIPSWGPACAMVVILAVVALTPWIFSPEEKKLFGEFVEVVRERIRKLRS